MNDALNIQNTKENSSLSITLSYKDINLIYKYLSRATLSGSEVPEFNYIIQLFEKDIAQSKSSNIN